MMDSVCLKRLIIALSCVSNRYFDLANNKSEQKVIYSIAWESTQIISCGGKLFCTWPHGFTIDGIFQHSGKTHRLYKQIDIKMCDQTGRLTGPNFVISYRFIAWTAYEYHDFVVVWASNKNSWKLIISFKYWIRQCADNRGTRPLQ